MHQEPKFRKLDQKILWTHMKKSKLETLRKLLLIFNCNCVLYYDLGPSLFIEGFPVCENDCQINHYVKRIGLHDSMYKLIGS